MQDSGGSGQTDIDQSPDMQHCQQPVMERQFEIFKQPTVSPQEGVRLQLFSKKVSHSERGPIEPIESFGK